MKRAEFNYMDGIDCHPVFAGFFLAAVATETLLQLSC